MIRREKFWTIATDLGVGYGGILEKTKSDAIAHFMDCEELEDTTWRQMYSNGYRAVRCVVEYEMIEGPR